jgi:hypothetical protein
LVNNASSDTISALARFSTKAAKAVSKSASTRQDQHFLSEFAGCVIQLAGGGQMREISRVHQQGYQRGRGQQFAQEFKPFRPKGIADDSHAGQIAARSIEARD